MIGRFLASTAVAGVLFTGAAMAQMSAPPNNAPKDQPAPIQTQNPGPRDQANPSRPPSTMNSDQQRRNEIGQAGGGTNMNRGSTDSGAAPSMTQDNRSMSQRAGDSMRNTGRKMKSSSDRSSGRMNKQSAEGHRMDNIADQLNACQAKPQADRQSCIDQATRM